MIPPEAHGPVLLAALAFCVGLATRSWIKDRREKFYERVPGSLDSIEYPGGVEAFQKDVETRCSNGDNMRAFALTWSYEIDGTLYTGRQKLTAHRVMEPRLREIIKAYQTDREVVVSYDAEDSSNSFLVARTGVTTDIWAIWSLFFVTALLLFQFGCQ